MLFEIRNDKITRSPFNLLKTCSNLIVRIAISISISLLREIVRHSIFFKIENHLQSKFIFVSLVEESQFQNHLKLF